MESREVVSEKVFDREVEAKLIALRSSTPPTGYNRWKLHLLVDKMVELKYVEYISHEGIRQLPKNEIKPWRERFPVLNLKFSFLRENSVFFSSFIGINFTY